SVTLGRFVHLRILLEYQLDDGGIALISEQRRMRSDEPHYLDHPAIGILARVDPVPVPDDLARLLDELEEFDQ
ncbi:MAG: CsiV family protein, partial [Gammaproteobacteria bacterium]|nr:CsiV family protein [Gammaproteobacteria bacterium]